MSIKKFHNSEKINYWLCCRNPKTFCRISTFLQRKDGGVLLISDNARSEYNIHAEIHTLKRIKLKLPDLLKEHYNPNNQSLVFDLVIRLNNSPCHDENCQSYITEWIQEIKELIPKASFRLILYFSHFYLEDQSTCPIETVLEYQTQWIVDLVVLGVVVIFCPIIVSEMVPKPLNRNPNLERIREYDEMCLRNFQNLLKKLEARKEVFEIFKSYNFYTNYKVLKLDRSVCRPQYISIYPPILKHFSKLPFKYSIPIVSKRTAKRVKCRTKKLQIPPKKGPQLMK